MKKYTLFILFLFNLQLAFSQRYSYLNYSVDKGLPQSQVSAITQDNNGYLWVGTMGGLAKFNGQTFVTYSAKDNLLSSRITALNFQEDSLLIGHEGGISIYFHGKFTHFPFGENNKNVVVSCLLKFKEQLYAFTNGYGVFLLQNGRFHQIKFPNDNQNRIRTAIIHNGQLYLATRGGILKSHDGKNYSILPNTEDFNVSGLIAYSNSQLFFTTFDIEAIFYNLETQAVHKLTVDPNLFGMRNCFLTSKKHIWIPYLDGILVIDQQLKQNKINKNTGLEYENVNAVFEDNNHNIWIGTEGKGLYKFTGTHIRVLNFTKKFNEGLIISSYIGKKNSVFGTYDGKIIIRNRKTNQTKIIEVNDTPIWTLAEVDETKILVGSGYGLYKLDLLSARIQPVSPKHSKILLGKITSILKRGNQFYIGGDFGLAVYENNDITKVWESRVNKILTIRSIVSNQKHGVMLGCDNGLFHLINGKIERIFNFKQKINSLLIDQKDRIWIGTSEGTYVLKNNTVFSVNLSERASSNLVNFINQNKDYIVFGTNDGIYFHSQNSDTYEFKHIGLEEGISNLETNINSSAINNIGEIYFGTASGLDVLNLKEFEQNIVPSIPRIVMESIDINFSPIQSKDTKDYKITYNSNQSIASIELPYKKNNILINIDGIALKNFHSLNYQYWIQGLEKSWSVKFKNSQINLTNLPFGKYVIKIRGEINHSYSNIISLSVVIRPPFYLSKWFISIASILIVLLILLLFIFLTKRERRKNHKEKEAISQRLGKLEQQSLNASMNRHFIFNSLNSIQYYINTQDKYAANKYLSNFAKLIRKNLDASSGNDSVVTLSEEIERLRLYLDLETMRFKDRFSYQIDEENVATENYLVPPMLLQPFVENSIIHGILPNENKKGEILITISDYLTHIEIKIHDNGIGVNYSKESKSVHNREHQSKGLEISSKRIQLLKEFHDRDYELIGPFQSTDDDGSISGTTVLIKIPK